jgi:hypothetical protein
MKMRSRWAAMRLWPPDPLVGRPEQRPMWLPTGAVVVSCR